MIPLPTYRNKNEQFSAFFKGKKYKDVLYVGAMVFKGKKPDGLHHLRSVSELIDCIEIWPKNVDDVRDKGWFDHAFEGDISEWHEIYGVRYDLVFWWHGPEHLERAVALRTIQRLKVQVPEICLGCPWGNVPQGAVYGNPHEVHRSVWMPSDFEEIGFDVSLSGVANRAGGNIFAWWPK